MQKSIANDVNKVYEELCSLKVPFWLMSGSALGAMLGGEMLPGDRDIDIGMYKEHRGLLDDCVVRLKSSGFSFSHRYDPVNREVKGMVTLRRNVPFDIKFYEKKDAYYWRALHKSHSLQASLVWSVIDFAYFGARPKVKIDKRIHRTIIYLLVIGFSSLFMTKRMRPILVSRLSRRWKNLKVEYGYEVLDEKWFKEFSSICFYDKPFLIFKNAKDYLDSEYGSSWRLNRKEYTSGGWSKPSHKVTSPLIFTGHR